MGQVERNTDWNDFNEVCQTRHFVDHEQNDFADSCQELSEEKFDTGNLKTEDLNHSEFSENWKNDRDDFNPFFQMDTVKEGPCEIDYFTRCGRYFNSYNNETYVVVHDHNYAACSCQEGKLGKRNLNLDDSDHSECSELSTIETDTPQFKSEDCIDIVYEDIKYETDEEKKSSELSRFCEVCYQSLDMETDIFKCTNYRLECRCRKEDESLFNDIHGEDMTHDVKKTYLYTIVHDIILSMKSMKPVLQSAVMDNIIHHFDKNFPLIKIKSDKKYTKTVYNAEVIMAKEHVCPSWQISAERTQKTKSTLKMLTIDSASLLLEVQDEAVSKNEVTREQRSPEVPQRLSIPSTRNDNKMKRKLRSKLHQNNFSVKHQMIDLTNEEMQCNFCSKCFTRRNALKTHEKIHTKEKSFVCETCSNSFSHKGDFKRHERSHTGEKTFNCKFCSKSFTRAGHLTVHERCHTGEKPFLCEICSKPFSGMAALKRHQRYHTDKNRFNCKICSKTFTTSYHLKVHGSVHERIHTGEKLYCKPCSRTFSNLGDLKVHERSHTVEKLFHSQSSKFYS